MVRRILMTSVLTLAAWPAPAQGEAWQDRTQWDWGQHRTGLAAETAVEPAVPVEIRDHWDYPGAPVRYAGHARQG